MAFFKLCRKVTKRQVGHSLLRGHFEVRAKKKKFICVCNKPILGLTFKASFFRIADGC